MYCDRNFKSKAEFKRAVKAGERVTLFAPGLGAPRSDGRETVCGPHYPAPHRWYANVEMANGIVVKVN